MTYKLLTLDLDGTLIDDSDSISRNNLSYKKKASMEGVKFLSEMPDRIFPILRFSFSHTG